MRERDLLTHIYGRSGDLSGAFPAVLVGPGDDCAVVATPRGDALLLTVDQLVEGRHIVLREELATRGRGSVHGATLEQMAHKAIARSVSDIAAMGGMPAWALATGLLAPDWPHADALFNAMASVGRAMGAPLVGGDIAMWGGQERAGEGRDEGEPACEALVLTVTVGGQAHEARGPVLRSGARPGDVVYVTGAVGGSLESGRHLSFSPRVAEGAWLCDLLGEDLHAMIDLSDGLGIDASRVGEASGVVVEIDAATIPLNEGVGDWRRGAAGGEDYELLFTAGPEARVPAKCPVTGVAVTVVGRVCEAGKAEEGGARIRTPGGEVIDAAGLGWDHGA